ncbi:MAG TPA: rod shape-determining protein MreC [Thermoanaerobaculia bacterium]|nr:rod shape-determining protein MreC [Thermoanaerobaculia bacterium]
MGSRASRWLLVLLLLGELLLLTRQASQRGREGPLMQGAAVGVLGPVAHGVSKVEHGFGSLGEGMRTRKRVMAENEQLRRQVDELQRQLLKLQTVEGAFLRLGGAVEYARRTHQPLHVADVVYADYTSWLRSLLLYVGERGAQPDQPVVDEHGLVGRVIAVGGGYAKVQLVTDRASAVGAMIERTGRQGVVRGDGHAGLELDYVPLQADVRPGDRVVTAGIDGIYPRGIAIGVVRAVSPGTQLFHHLEVTPLVDFGSLDHAYLLPPLPDARVLSESLSRDLR